MSSKINKAVNEATTQGFLLNPEAIKLMREYEDTVDIVDIIRKIIRSRISSSEVIVTREDLAEYLATSTKLNSQDMDQGTLESEVKVIKDPGNSVTPSKDPYNFVNLFQSRYRKLRAITLQRPGLNSIKPITAFDAKSGMIGGLLMSRKVKRDLIQLTLEDESGSGEVLVADPNVKREVESLCLDQYIVAQVQRSKSGSIFASGVIWPDVPEHKARGARDDVYAVFTSDLQVGSASFMRKEFERFLEWLNGRRDKASQASRVRYLLIAGDLIDGVGIYPGQEVNLSIKDVYSQYEELAELLRKVPERIKVIIIPGNHDSVRQALPQPRISKNIAAGLYGLGNIVSLGNPAQIIIHGVSILMFHGSSLDDVVTSVRGVSFKSPTSGIKVLLRARHLAPIYGGRTSIVPNITDELVIEEVPDIMHVGHIHTTGTERYRGTLMISSGTWQAQTPYQSKMGIKPDPSVVTIVNLKDLSVDTHRFNEA